MTSKRFILILSAIAIALTLSLYVQSAYAAPVHQTNIVINDYVYDAPSVNWINVNTYAEGVPCRKASIILMDMIGHGHAVEFTGPPTCPYSVSYSVYHGRQVYRIGFSHTYRLRFNEVHTNLWFNHTHVYPTARPYHQSTVRVLKPRVQYRHTYRVSPRGPSKAHRSIRHHHTRRVNPSTHRTTPRRTTPGASSPRHKQKPQGASQHRGKRGKVKNHHRGKRRLAHHRR